MVSYISAYHSYLKPLILQMPCCHHSNSVLRQIYLFRHLRKSFLRLDLVKHQKTLLHHLQEQQGNVLELDQCHRCAHEWVYFGSKTWTNCTACRTAVSFSSTKTRQNNSKLQSGSLLARKPDCSSTCCTDIQQT